MEDDNDVLDLYQLISDPLTATISADYEVADRYYAILRKYAFGDDPNESRVQTIAFDFINSEGKKQTAEIPLLTLMPLPLLHISEASFEFNVNINSSQAQSSLQPKEEDNPPVISGKNAVLLDTPLFMKQLNSSARIKVSIPKTPATPAEGTFGSNEANANMKVSIKMEQSDMPLGLLSILQTVADGLRVSNTVEEPE